MKLFQSLLVAPAALGLMSPLAVSASEVNLNDISIYSDVDSIEFANSFGKVEANDNKLIAGGEGLVSGDSYDGGFSSTTTASFSTDFYFGGVDGGTDATADPFMLTYGFQIDLNTSFTGEDSLDISLDGGNTSATTTGVSEFDGNVTADSLDVDGVSYTFPLGGATAFVADNGDASALFTTACTYGGPSNTLDDCGNVNAGPSSGGTAAGASYDFGNGWAAAIGYQNVNGEEDHGILSEESTDTYALNGSYTGSNYGLSVTYSSKEDGAHDSATSANEDVEEEDTYIAFNAYYTPEVEGFPSISVGYEFGDIGGAAAASDEQASFMIGLTWDEVGPGSAGVAAGYSNKREDQDELTQYEAYYSYPVNDSMTITPLIYTLDAAGDLDDTTGMMVKTSFSF